MAGRERSAGRRTRAGSLRDGPRPEARGPGPAARGGTAGAGRASVRGMARWTSFVADPESDPPRILHENGNAAHRLRVEHDDRTLLIHLSGEDGDGWLTFAVDRASRQYAVAEGPRQIDAARGAYERLYAAD